MPNFLAVFSSAQRVWAPDSAQNCSAKERFAPYRDDPLTCTDHVPQFNTGQHLPGGSTHETNNLFHFNAPLMAKEGATWHTTACHVGRFPTLSGPSISLKVAVHKIPRNPETVI